MSDQQQASLHKWEIVSQGELGDNAATYRMRVPGGWLYRYQPNITSPPSSMASVPEAASGDFSWCAAAVDGNMF